MLFEHVRGVESQNQSERQTDLAFVPDAENSVATSAQTSGDQPENPKAVSGEAADPGIAIRSSAKAFVTAFDRGDAAAIAGLWTADGEYLDDAGNRFSGRKAIEQEYVRFFAEHPGAKIEIKIDAIRLIGADAAIEDGHAVLTLPHSPAQPA
ncbi:MAG TPA: SgcJ/EcaC family oxidoreductase, partial [Pirellulales bacterium]|nr:SgcJ/EcaC family oxidoreductase [Pirellulales bacterium]